LFSVYGSQFSITFCVMVCTLCVKSWISVCRPTWYGISLMSAKIPPTIRTKFLYGAPVEHLMGSLTCSCIYQLFPNYVPRIPGLPNKPLWAHALNDKLHDNRMPILYKLWIPKLFLFRNNTVLSNSKPKMLGILQTCRRYKKAELIICFASEGKRHNFHCWRTSTTEVPRASWVSG
jgi:hypothetical protein